MLVLEDDTGRDAKVAQVVRLAVERNSPHVSGLNNTFKLYQPALSMR